MTIEPKNLTRTRSGFTLVEIIIAITVSAILAVVLVQFFSVHSGRSWLPVQNVTQGMALQSAMDQITSDYRNLLLTADKPLKTLEEKIDGGAGVYWSDPNISIKVNHCITFVGGSGLWTEEKTHDTCVHTEDPEDPENDTLLKVTLSLGDQTLTSIFAR